MAEIHQNASLSPAKLELLPTWMSTQRWYAAKGRVPKLRRLWSWRLDDPAGPPAHEIPVGPGRGSGAGSLVAWVLTITALDPM